MFLFQCPYHLSFLCFIWLFFSKKDLDNSLVNGFFCNIICCNKFYTSSLILWCDHLMRQVLFVPQAMRLRQADLWYRSSFDHSRSVATSPNSSLSSQHSSLAVEPAAQHGPSSLRCLKMSVYNPYGSCFIATFFKLHLERLCKHGGEKFKQTKYHV